MPATNARLNENIADQPIAALREDGITGKQCTIVMIDRFNSVPTSSLQWKVQWSPAVDQMLAPWTPSRPERVVRSEGVIGRRFRNGVLDAVEEKVPRGAIVDVDEERGVLTCTLSRYDTFPQANTPLEDGRIICFGCPLSCQVEVGPLTAAGAGCLRSYTDATGILTRPVKIDEEFVKKLPDNLVAPELELLPGSRRVHCAFATEALAGGMPHRLPEAVEDMFVTFEYNPHATLRHLLRTVYEVPEEDLWPGHFDLDYFTLSHACVNKIRSVGDVNLRELGIRAATGVSVVGYARLRPDGHTYDIVWFPGPDEIVRAGDLCLVMREPSCGTRPNGDSVRIVRDEDLTDFAEAEIQREAVLCAICQETAPTIKFEPCNHHVVCVDCAMRLEDRRCPMCRHPVGKCVLSLR
jgi:hypothetical protein